MDDKLRHTLIRAVQDAGRLILRSDRTARHKSRRDLVTEADRKSERLIKKAVREYDPTISVWGEEFGKDANENERMVIVDPLDGTTNFAKGLGLYSVMAAYFEAGAPQLGIVFIPETSDMLIAEKGKGTRLNERRVQVSQRADLAEAVISCNRSNHPEMHIPKVLRIIELLAENALSWRNLGTAGVEYSYVASGRLDGIITPVAEAVHFAGYIIMQEAGANVTDHHGNRISVESASVVAANPKLHGPLLEIAQDALR